MDSNSVIQEAMGRRTGSPAPQRGDPAMDMAIQAFTDAYGHPPETDEEWAECESMLNAAMQPDTATAVVDQVAPEGDGIENAPAEEPSYPADPKTRAWDGDPAALGDALSRFKEETGRMPTSDEDWNEVYDIFDDAQGDD